MTAGWVNWRRRLAMAAVAAVAALSLAGLRAAAGQSATDHGASASRAGASRASTERIVDFAFRPTPLTVGAGTKVVFSNQGATTHTATRNGGGFDTGRIRPGSAASVTFKRPGTYSFHCTIHPFMKGRIVVR